jgi:hypothetical protein
MFTGNEDMEATHFVALGARNGSGRRVQHGGSHHGIVEDLPPRDYLGHLVFQDVTVTPTFGGQSIEERRTDHSNFSR